MKLSLPALAVCRASRVALVTTALASSPPGSTSEIGGSGVGGVGGGVGVVVAGALRVPLMLKRRSPSWAMPSLSNKSPWA